MQRGFSLVELSIVLVILGLLTGGILAGQSLIRAAELRSVTTEYGRWVTAMHSFRDKYMGIPGDMRDSTRFWGHQTTTGWCSNTSGAAVSVNGTCDGNGNGTISLTAAANQGGENFAFWRQLALAGLIEGTYSGVAGPTNAEDSIIAVNIPSSKFSQAGWSSWGGDFPGDPYSFRYNYGIGFTYGAAGGQKAQGRIMKPEEAWNIDMKMDDGRPATGKVVARFWNNECSIPNSGAASNTNYDASYNLGDSAIRCALHFPNLF